MPLGDILRSAAAAGQAAQNSGGNFSSSTSQTFQMPGGMGMGGGINLSRF